MSRVGQTSIKYRGCFGHGVRFRGAHATLDCMHIILEGRVAYGVCSDDQLPNFGVDGEAAAVQRVDIESKRGHGSAERTVMVKAVKRNQTQRHLAYVFTRKAVLRCALR